MTVAASTSDDILEEIESATKDAAAGAGLWFLDSMRDVDESDGEKSVTVILHGSRKNAEAFLARLSAAVYEVDGVEEIRLVGEDDIDLHGPVKKYIEEASRSDSDAQA